MDSTKGSEAVKRSKSPKRILSSDCSLQLDCMKPESLVIAGLHTGRMCPEPCGRRPSSCESRGASEVAEALFMELSAEDEALQLGLSRNKAVVGEPSRRLGFASFLRILETRLASGRFNRSIQFTLCGLALL